MAEGATILAVVLIIIGIILLVMGVMSYEQNKNMSTANGGSSWTPWLLIGGGILFFLIGLGVAFWGYRSNKGTTHVHESSHVYTHDPHETYGHGMSHGEYVQSMGQGPYPQMGYPPNPYATGPFDTAPMTAPMTAQIPTYAYQ